MTDSNKTVFISYRRSVSSYIARAIFMDLRHNDYDAFMDVESIDSGEFDRIILGQIAARAHFLVILTPGSVERCVEPGDWLRREIEEAIRLERNIVPILANGFDFKDAEQYLNGELSKISKFSAIEAPHLYFDEAMTRLRTRFLRAPVKGTITPTPLTDNFSVQHKIELNTSQSTPSETQLTAEEFFIRGLKREKNDFDGQIEDYSEAIRLNPQYASAYHNRGIASAGEMNFYGAISDYTEAIRLNPNFAEAYNSRGLANKKIRGFRKALNDFTEAIRLNPKFIAAYNNRGLVYIRMKDYDKAIADFTEAIRLDPLISEVYSNRGNALADKGEYDDAISEYTEAIRLNPNNTLAYYNRGLAYEKKQDFHNALNDLQKYLDLGGIQNFGNHMQVERHIQNLRKIHFKDEDME